jgi:hypothetical protein
MSSTINSSIESEKLDGKVQLKESIIGQHETSGSWAIVNSSTIVPGSPERKERQCEFCSKIFRKIDENSKYCSANHKQAAARRRVSARLRVPARISRLDPLYFDME